MKTCLFMLYLITSLPQAQGADSLQELRQRNAALKAQLLKYQKENEALRALVSQLETKGELSPQDNIVRDQLRRQRIHQRAHALWQPTPTAPPKLTWSESLREWIDQYPQEFSFDEKSHSILLNAHRADLFKRASAELEATTKASLAKLARFLSAAYVRGESEVQRLQIIGHASPSYRGNPITPELAAPSARKFNRDLSSQRAQSARDFLLGLGSDLPPLTTSGAGFEYPLLKTGRTPASDACGPYDCARSRRLEIKIYP